MLSFFSPAVKTEETHFEKTKEVKELIPLIQELKLKLSELEKFVDGNASNKAYTKCVIMGNIVSQLDRAINQYNNSPACESNAAELMSIIKLVNVLHKVISGSILKYAPILNQQRTDTKSIAKTAIGVTTLIASVGVGIATGSIIYAGASLFVASPEIDKQIIKATGLNDPRSASLRILEDMAAKLDLIRSTLHLVINDLTFDEQVNNVLFLCCPITHEKIRKPALCLLDQRMYEKEPLEKWLTENRRSYINNKEMQDGQSVKDVIVENISLKEALAEFETMQLESRLHKLAEEKEEKKAVPAPM